ncbi:MAG: DinB family protein [Phycisphaeraceae bacterium]|nr:MAG: DinB family protein [Phycisphaeraceae bacterium]
MNAEGLIGRLERFPEAMCAAAAVVSAEDAKWKPDDGAWSILEIVRHLGDEEVEDFRARLQSTLRDPAAPWTPIDPEGAARERRYNDGDLGEALSRFERERADSVAWLRSLGDGVDWSVAHEHPKLGPITAASLLASWAAHDALHLRQIARRMFELAQRDGGGASTLYAGKWGA